MKVLLAELFIPSSSVRLSFLISVLMGGGQRILHFFQWKISVKGRTGEKNNRSPAENTEFSYKCKKKKSAFPQHMHS